MSNAVFYCSFKLKKGAETSSFLTAAEKLNNEFISKQKGYISWNQLSDNDTWIDLITFESMDDAKSFEENSINAGELAQNFYSFINMNSCRVQYLTVEKSYK